MVAIQSKKFNWVRTPTARESNATWAAKRRAQREDFAQSQTLASNAFLNAASNQIDGMGTIIGQIALNRVIAEGKAKTAAQAEAAKLATEVDTSKANIKDSIFSGSSSGQLDSGTKIDLDGGTITLSDGTVIDAKTGAKKINFVT